jgi:hypothetical protein
LKEGGDRLPTDEEAAADLEKRRTREEEEEAEWELRQTKGSGV